MCLNDFISIYNIKFKNIENLKYGNLKKFFHNYMCDKKNRVIRKAG